MDRQRAVEDAGLFGEIAINMQLLSIEQVNSLLNKQKEYDSILGQILVLSGALSKGKKEEELKLFHKKLEEED